MYKYVYVSKQYFLYIYIYIDMKCIYVCIYIYIIKLGGLKNLLHFFSNGGGRGGSSIGRTFPPIEQSASYVSQYV